MDKPSMPQPLHQEVINFLNKPLPMFIGGKWVSSASGKTFSTFNPASGKIIAYVAEGDKEDIDKAVKAARKAFDENEGDWRKLTPDERERLILRLADLVEQNAEILAQLETLNNGMNINNARGIVKASAQTFRYMAGWATKISGKAATMMHRTHQGDLQEVLAYTLREPVGVVGAIIPWNVPIMMITGKLAPALAAGCTIVLKPAEQTPLTALKMAELVEQAGFPPGVVNVVPGYGETAGAALVEHPEVNKITFTGSLEVGKLIKKNAANTLKRITLELGGKSPNVVFHDADMQTAIVGSAMAVYLLSGQMCLAGSRLFIEESIYESVVAGICNFSKNLKVGDGLDPTNMMGPLISQEQLKRVSGYIESGINDGAKIVAGGGYNTEGGYFVQPTLFMDTKPDMKIVREEIFGPVIVAIPFKTIEQVAAAANNTNYGLAAGVWTKDINKAHKLASRIQAGTVWVNTYLTLLNDYPFGGFKQSGIGREGGIEGVESYTEIKSVFVNLG